jgi:hypothetical protein
LFRLHATSVPFFEQLTKLKPSADPYRPTGSKDKDKMLATEALGLVMIDYGNDAGGDYGESPCGRVNSKQRHAREYASNEANKGQERASYTQTKQPQNADQDQANRS